MLARAFFDGQMSRQQWWTGILFLIAAWLVWSLGSGFVFTGPSGSTIAAFLSLIFLLPLAMLCARRLNDLGRPLAKTLALLITPFALHSVFKSLTLAASATTLEIADTQAVVMAPTLVGWIVIAWLLAALGWMVVVLGMRPGSLGAEASAA